MNMILYMEYDKAEKQTHLRMIDHSEMIVHHAIPYIVDQLCQMYACTYEGRKQAIMKALGIKQKIPILLSEQSNDFFFPVTCIRKHHTYWLNYRYIEKVRQLSNTCEISMHDFILYLPIDSRVVKAQMKRCVCYLQYLEAFKHRDSWKWLKVEGTQNMRIAFTQMKK